MSPSQITAQALPCLEIATTTRVLHVMEQPSTCSRRMTWPPSPHVASLAEFMVRLKRLKGIKTRAHFTLELGNRRSSWARTEGTGRNSFCLAASHASSADTTLSILGTPQVPTMGPHSHQASPGTAGATRAVLEPGSEHRGVGVGCSACRA